MIKVLFIVNTSYLEKINTDDSKVLFCVFLPDKGMVEGNAPSLSEELTQIIFFDVLITLAVNQTS